MPAPPPPPEHAAAGAAIQVQVRDRACMEPGSSGGCRRQRLHLRVTYSKAGLHGSLRLSGHLLGWSFTEMSWPKGREERTRVVRFAGAAGSELWDFWVRSHIAFHISIRKPCKGYQLAVITALVC